MKATIATLCMLALLSGCTTIQDARNPPGTLHADGRIEPCHDWRTDVQACGNAVHNAPLLPQIQLGMTKDEVLRIMRHPAERSEARIEAGAPVEIWKYMQDYEQERMSAIEFTHGRVTAIRTVAWDD